MALLLTAHQRVRTPAHHGVRTRPDLEIHMIGDLICILLIAGDAALTIYCVLLLGKGGNR
ncbi:hypothetical protein ACGF0D_43065 [Kitasatospora sp. NPDC048298]|uniref:hypothetical protein n=1 Tax=Kitasatospora sp. NPDC048298 TaxID=3364049 RepID=UPI0037116DEF